MNKKKYLPPGIDVIDTIATTLLTGSDDLVDTGNNDYIPVGEETDDPD